MTDDKTKTWAIEYAVAEIEECDRILRKNGYTSDDATVSGRLLRALDDANMSISYLREELEKEITALKEAFETLRGDGWCDDCRSGHTPHKDDQGTWWHGTEPGAREDCPLWMFWDALNGVSDD